MTTSKGNVGKICDEAEEGKEGKRLLRHLKPFFITKLNVSMGLNSLPIQQMDGKVGDVSCLADKKSPFLEWVGEKNGQKNKKSIMFQQL